MSPSTSTRRGVTEQAAVAAIDSGTRVLRLPTIRDRFTEIAAAAEREQLSYLGFLAELVMAECDDRDKRRAARRIHDASFPRDKRIEEFDFEANSSVSAAVIHQLVTCAWVKAGHPLCLIGDSGTGKSHLLIGLGTAAAEAGYRVRYTLASKLVNELVEAADDKQLSKTIARYGRVDLLCLDELGYSATWNSTGGALNCCSKFSPSERSGRRSRSPPTSRSPAGRRPSPTRGSAPPSSTA
jgi:DNA replication protein DnaC